MSPSMRILMAVVVACLIPVGVSAQTAGFEGFLARLTDAQAMLRAASADLRSGRTDSADQTLKRLQPYWSDMVDIYRTAPPGPFRRVALFADALDGSAARIGRAAQAAAEGRAEAALDELGPLRRDWLMLRRSAGLYGLGECLDEASEALDAFQAYRRNPPDMARGEARGEIYGRAAVYRYAVKRCETFVSGETMAEAEFRRILESINAALDVVSTAVRLRDAGLLDRILQDLKGMDAQLTQRFG